MHGGILEPVVCAQYLPVVLVAYRIFDLLLAT